MITDAADHPLFARETGKCSFQLEALCSPPPKKKNQDSVHKSREDGISLSLQ